MKTAHELLVEARKRLAGGWIQRGLINHDHLGHASYCLLGALLSVRGEVMRANNYKEEDGQIQQAYTQAREIIGQCIEQAGGFGSSLTEYNDNPARTKDEVLAVVDCAIKKLAVPA